MQVLSEQYRALAREEAEAERLEVLSGGVGNYIACVQAEEARRAALPRYRHVFV